MEVSTRSGKQGDIRRGGLSDRLPLSSQLPLSAVLKRKAADYQLIHTLLLVWFFTFVVKQSTVITPPQGRCRQTTSHSCGYLTEYSSCNTMKRRMGIRNRLQSIHCIRRCKMSGTFDALPRGNSNGRSAVTMTCKYVCGGL